MDEPGPDAARQQSPESPPAAAPEEQVSAAFRALVAELGSLEERILSGPNTPLHQQSLLEGYKWIFSILQVALDTQVWADPARPRFVDIVGPYKKWGGDNADAFYQFAPLDPSRRYRVRGRRGDAVYLSLTVYGGPRDGRYSERIVGTRNDRTLGIAADGTFELMMGPEPADDGWLALTPDSVCAITRDYLIDPVAGRRAEWRIEAVDPPEMRRGDAADLAARLTAARTFVRDQAQMVPLDLGTPNTIDPPYPVPTETFGWAAGDAAYAMGSFALGDGEALVIDGRSPPCRFWNLCLWNQFLHTYNYDYERVTINGGQVEYHADGSWTVVVAGRDPGTPNWVATAGHPQGRIWLRWFCPEHTPERPDTQVVPLHEVQARWATRAG